MNDYNYGQQPPMFPGSGAMAAESEQTLSTYVGRIMRRVFGKMFLGVLVTALVSLAVASSPALIQAVFASKFLIWGLIIAEFAVVLILSARINKMSSATATAMFYLYAILTGVTLTPILFVYTGDAIIRTFFITAGVFGVMCAYGYLTKKDLSKMGSILIMCLLGLIVVTIVNLFLASTTLDWIISLVGVGIFIGLTAWDTQKIKQVAAETDYTQVDKLATLGALDLYLDFINLFLYLLRIFGDRN